MVSPCIFQITKFMNLVRITPYLLLVCFMAACQGPLIPDDDAPTQDANWQLIDYQSERLILGLHATPFEWYLISENQFARFDGEDGLLEKRPLDMNDGVKGTPVLSDNAFMRLSTNPDASQRIEFHLTRNPAQIVKIEMDSLAAPGNEVLQPDITVRRLGAFSDIGNLFLMPVQVLPERYYAFFLFELHFNTAHTQLESVEVVERIDLEDLPANINSLVNIRFLDGNFYVTSQEGAWRITPSGAPLKIFTQWMRDFFPWQGKLYATGYSDYDLHESTDNGLTWLRLNHISELEMVETPGDLVLTHTVLGMPYMLADTGFIERKAIKYPASAPTDFSTYYGAVFFAGRYYFSMDRKVHSTEQVVGK